MNDQELPKYVLIRQTFLGLDSIQEYREFLKGKPHPSYEEKNELIVPDLSFGLFQVNEDGTIGECLRAFWDTSD